MHKLLESMTTTVTSLSLALLMSTPAHAGRYDSIVKAFNNAAGYTDTFNGAARQGYPYRGGGGGGGTPMNNYNPPNRTSPGGSPYYPHGQGTHGVTGSNAPK